jgi:glycosyltransferase involved in cell wall biosynthesis
MLDAWALRHSALKKRVAGWVFENQNLRQAACLHALCESEAKSYRNYGLRNPICVIPNGIEAPGAGKSAIEGPIRRNGLAAGRKVLLYLGRIHPKKGIMNLIRAWAAIRQSEWILAIAGWDQGGHEQELKSLATELGIAWSDIRGQKSDGNCPVSSSQASAFGVKNASLLFLGPQFGDNKASCYADCNAFILPSFSEGLPMVILEAWAYGKAVLMTAECNLPEGFAANAAISIVPNVASIICGLKSLFEASAESVQAFGANGRALVANRFNWHKCALDMIEVYRWLLGDGAKPRVVVS